MTKVVNLRIARKRAAREKAHRQAAENRQLHGTGKAARKQISAARTLSRRILDQHKIESGEHR